MKLNSSKAYALRVGLGVGLEQGKPKPTLRPYELRPKSGENGLINLN